MTDYTAHHRPDDARALYVTLRSAGITQRLAQLNNEKGEIETTLAALQTALRSHTGAEIARLNFKELEKNQRRHGEVVVAIDRLESLVLTNEVSRSMDELDAEFDQIIAMPQIAAIKAECGSLRIVVCGQVEYEGRLYDTGDWEISLSRRDRHFDSRVLRSTYVKRGWQLDSYPSYYNMGKFCFGSNLYAIEQYVSTGQILAAVQLAVYCICSVSEGDQYRIPFALKRINRSEAI